jgi:putative transposase
MFRELLHRRVLALQEGRPALQGRLSAFADVLIPDGCAFKIASALAGVWPGTGTPAEFKLHAVYSVRAGGLAELHASAGSVHDNKGFGPGAWVPHALYIWDLGYQDYDRFVGAVLSKAIPLQRLKDHTNPVVLAWYDADGVRRPLRDAEGAAMRLQEASAFGHLPLHGTLDLDVEIRDTLGRGVTARGVCVPHGEDRWYLTTLPREVFTPFDVAELYRVRWEVELFFRDLKGAVRLDEVTRLKNPASLRMALLASLVAATLGQQLTAALNAQEVPPRNDTEAPRASLLRDGPTTSARSHPAPPDAGLSPLRARHGSHRPRRARTG